MERRLKNIKQTLDKSVLNNINISEEEKNRIISNLEQKHQRKARPYKYYFSLTAAAILFFLLFIPSFTQNFSTSERPDSQYVKLEEQLSEVIGADLFIPENEKYPIGLATINFAVKVVDGKPAKGEPIGASLYYLTDLDEKMDLSEEERIQWEESSRQEIAYGDFYQSDGVIHIDLFRDGIGTISYADTIEIKGHTVQFHYAAGSFHDMVTLGFDFNGVGYLVNYHLIDGNTEEDAKQFVQSFLQRVSYDEDKVEKETNVQVGLTLLEMEHSVTRYYISENGEHVPKLVNYRLVFKNNSDEYIGGDHSVYARITPSWDLRDKYGLARTSGGLLSPIAPGQEVEGEVIVDFPLPAGYQNSEPIEELEDPEIVKQLHVDVLQAILEVYEHNQNRDVHLEMDLTTFSSIH